MGRERRRVWGGRIGQDGEGEEERMGRESRRGWGGVEGRYTVKENVD